jgi:hypothetical protein
VEQKKQRMIIFIDKMFAPPDGGAKKQRMIIFIDKTFALL